ncbi:MAG: hypothetical protein H0V93_00315 [Euzebyales bacterium]|nr:hypothetical protein [Euzebyales bacterium]
MDVDRRRELVATATDLLPTLEQAVTSGWGEMSRGSGSWPPEAMSRARDAVRATLEGVVMSLELGDVDEDTWVSVRDHLERAESPELPVADLLRGVRVVGLETLVAHLDARCHLRPDERWTVQRQVDAFCQQLGDVEDVIDQAAVTGLLARLEADGPDVA